MNILLNFIEKEEGYFELKKLALSDFGISSVLKKSVILKAKIYETGVSENVDYMAPEVLS